MSGSKFENIPQPKPEGKKKEQEEEKESTSEEKIKTAGDFRIEALKEQKEKIETLEGEILYFCDRIKEMCDGADLANKNLQEKEHFRTELGVEQARLQALQAELICCKEMHKRYAAEIEEREG